MQLQKLKAIDVESWHNTLTDSGRKDGRGGISNRTVGHAHRILSKALKEAARFDLIIKNVAHIQAPPKVDGGEVQIIEEHRLQELLTRLRDNAIYPKVIISLFCGLRRSEVLALKWRNVDLDRKVIMVREALEETRSHGIQFKAPKSKAGKRDISLPDIVVDTLREYRRSQLEFRCA